MCTGMFNHVLKSCPLRTIDKTMTHDCGFSWSHLISYKTSTFNSGHCAIESTPIVRHYSSVYMIDVR